MSKDTIYREDAIKAVWKPQVKPNELIFDALKTAIESEINNVPSADRPQGDSVNRRYLLAEIDDLADEFSELDENGLHGERWCGIMDAKGVIVNAPDVSDRPEGEWIDISEWYAPRQKCSICETIVAGYGSNFCPNCGARMKGADDE